MPRRYVVVINNKQYHNTDIMTVKYFIIFRICFIWKFYSTLFICFYRTEIIGFIFFHRNKNDIHKILALYSYDGYYLKKIKLIYFLQAKFIDFLHCFSTYLSSYLLQIFLNKKRRVNNFQLNNELSN